MLSSKQARRRYICHICIKSFYRLDHCKRHLRIHTGEKPYICTHSGCSKRFSRSDELIRHIRTHNKNSNEEEDIPIKIKAYFNTIDMPINMPQNLILPPPQQHVPSKPQPVECQLAHESYHNPPPSTIDYMMPSGLNFFGNNPCPSNYQHEKQACYQLPPIRSLLFS